MTTKKVKVLITQILSDIEKEKLVKVHKTLELHFLQLIQITPLSLSLESINKLNKPEAISWLIFTSKISVDILYASYPNLFDTKKLDIRFAAVGEETQACLVEKGVVNVFMPKSGSSGKHLAQELLASQNIRGKMVIYPRAQNGRKDIMEIFKASGEELTTIDLYQTSSHQLAQVHLKKMISRSLDWITLSSPSTVNALFELLDQTELNSLKNKTRFMSIGPMTTQKAKLLGLMVHAEVKKPSLENLLQAIELV